MAQAVGRSCPTARTRCAPSPPARSCFRKRSLGKTRCTPRDDDVLPESLEGAIQQAAESVGVALRAGAVMADEGDQQKYWTITRYFAELVARQLEGTCKVLYPDMGSAAMLKNAWPDAGFEIGSLSDRNPIQETYSALIIAAPDPQVLEDTKRVTALAGEVPVILFNPRLVSGDVGIGLNVRRMRSVFRKYPDMWKVFVEDEDQPGRYRLVHESTNKPQGETLDLILLEAFPPIQGDEEESGVKSMLESAGRTIASMQRFLRNVSR